MLNFQGTAALLYAFWLKLILGVLTRACTFFSFQATTNTTTTTVVENIENEFVKTIVGESERDEEFASENVSYKTFHRITIRISRSQMFFKIGILKNFANFKRKHLCWSLFLIKLQTCNFIKKRLWHKCFEFFSQNASGGCF